MYVCSCFGITEAQVKHHADAGRRTPRAIAGACKAGTDCGYCVRRIQALLGRGPACATPVAATLPAPGAAPDEVPDEVPGGVPGGVPESAAA